MSSEVEGLRAALNFKQGLIEDISRDCVAAEDKAKQQRARAEVAEAKVSAGFALVDQLRRETEGMDEREPVRLILSVCCGTVSRGTRPWLIGRAVVVVTAQSTNAQTATG